MCNICISNYYNVLLLLYICYLFYVINLFHSEVIVFIRFDLIVIYRLEMYLLRKCRL